MKKSLSRQVNEEETKKNNPVPTNRTPRWVKVFGVIALVLVLLLVILHLTGNGFGRHGMHTLPFGVHEQGAKQS